MKIRLAELSDKEAIRGIHLAAFDECESDLVADLAIKLLLEETIPVIVNLVAEYEGNLTGHVSFSPIKIDGSSNTSGYILAPLGIHPKFQNRGLGTKLVEAGIERLRSMGVEVVLVYGDPNYYNKFGFTKEFADSFIAPYPLKYPSGWQAMNLKQCNKGYTPTKISCVESLEDPQLW